MKKFQLGLITLALTGVLSAGYADASTPNSNVEVNSSTTSVSPVDIHTTSEKVVKPVKKEKPTFVITKATVYQQLSHDLKKEGYRLSWRINQDFPTPITTKTYKTWQDSLLAMLDTVNKEGLYNSQNGTTVEALICPEANYVVVTSQNNAAGVVDLDKHGCNLISKAPTSDSDDSSVLDSSSNNDNYIDSTYTGSDNSGLYDQSSLGNNSNPGNNLLSNNVNNSNLNPTPNSNSDANLQAFPPIDSQGSGANISALNN